MSCGQQISSNRSQEDNCGLCRFYERTFPPSGREDVAVLDLCSSWISHYPKGYTAGRIAGTACAHVPECMVQYLYPHVTRMLCGRPGHERGGAETQPCADGVGSEGPQRRCCTSTFLLAVLHMVAHACSAARAFGMLSLRAACVL